MTEDPERQIRRNNLCKERAKFSQAQKWLSAVYKNTDEADEDKEMAGYSDDAANGSGLFVSMANTPV